MTMKKRGSVLDVLLIAIFLFAFGVSFLMVHYAVNTSADQLMNNSQINDSADFMRVMGETKDRTDRLDYFIAAVFFAFVLALIIASFLVPAQPIFMFIFLIVNMIIVALSAVLSYVWNDIAARSTFIQSITSFPITNHLLSNLPIYITIVALLSLAITYAKPYIFEGQQQ
jgi:hypothetical protein